MNLTPDFFFIQKDVFRAEALFKQSVQTVEISISSFCNRRCSYCPNSLTDRISAKYFMADSLFFNVMRQLCKIEFDGEVHINRYNEPLADRAYALKRIAEVKAFLPKCRLVVFTNGDYLDEPYVRALSEAGVDKILATVHEAAGGTSYSDLLTDQERRLKKLGLPFTYEMNLEGNKRVAIVETNSNMIFHYVVQDFHGRDDNGVLWMQDRAQALPVEKGMTRIAPCYMPFAEMQIEWDGELLPCCQIQPDAFDKNQYSIGKLTESSNIFFEYTGEHYVRWRRELFSYAIKKAPCTTCSYGGTAQDSEEMKTIVNDYRRILHFDKFAQVTAEPAENVLCR